MPGPLCPRLGGGARRSPLHRHCRRFPYRDAIAWAVEQGITNGTSETTFSPSNLCTRGQIVTFLHRYNNL